MSTAIIASFLGGILPAILWLDFWLRKSTHQEPRHLIVGAFLLGMFSVLIAGPLEAYVAVFTTEYSLLSLIIWAMIEETVKFVGADASGLNTRFCDDPVDPSLYLITSALGFAAAENILFLIDSFSSGDISKVFATITFRFIGATLLHVIASGAIGIAMGISFKKSKLVRHVYLFFGFLVAILLHASFNSFIIKADGNVLWVFAGVWIILLVIILVLEKIKSSKRIIRAEL